VRPPPSPWVETFISRLALTAPERGLSDLHVSLRTVSAWQKGLVCEFVSASEISVPRSSGDRFDSWMVTAQSSLPSRLLIRPRRRASQNIGRLRSGAFIL
jgi:hypothetical protein